MAFCTSCGAQLDTSSQFCVKCGARQAAGVGAAAPRTAAPSQGANTAAKIVLIIVAGIVVLGVVGTIASLLIVRKVVRDTKVAVSDKGEERVVTPFGTVETTKDPAKIAEKLDVEIYPGAKAVEGGSDVRAMGMHTVTGIFETSDPVDKVAAFYRERYPKGIYTASGGEHNLAVPDKGSMISIHMQDEGGRTRITIANVAGKGMGTN